MIINDKTIQMEIIDNTTTLYSFYNNEGDLILESRGEKPAAITPNKSLAKSFKHVLNPMGALKTKEVNAKYYNLMEKLQKEHDELYSEYIMEKMKEQGKKEHDLLMKKNAAKELLKSMDQPLVYIGSLLDWMTAGERLNTLLCFVAYCSQVILKNPISVIGLGESSSGKTFVSKTALNLIPDEFISYEKMITPSAIFNRSKEDPYFYEGKICVYGDMGGENDQELQSDSKALMKELQTEGYLNKPISIKEGDEWITKNLELFGRPALTYTTVPNYIFDDQELSRSIIFTPRTDNKHCFIFRQEFLEFKGGVTYKKYSKYESQVNKIKDIVLYLRDVLEEYDIINPYFGVVSEILSKSKYYKRDIVKYNDLLKVITAINFHKNLKYDTEDGQKLLFTSNEDVQLFLSLISPYLDSIRENISPKASEILKSIKKMLDEDGYYHGITTADFQETHPELSKRSVQNYFRELNAAGLIKIVGKENRFNLYDITPLASIKHNPLKAGTDEFIRNELGDDVAELLASEVVDEDVELSVMDQHEGISKPPWGCN